MQQLVFEAMRLRGKYLKFGSGNNSTGLSSLTSLLQPHDKTAPFHGNLLVSNLLVALTQRAACMTT